MNERHEGGGIANGLTIAGMILTILLSVGGTWATNLVHTNINDTKIATLMDDNRENKLVNTIVYKLDSRVSTVEGSLLTTQSDIKVMDTKLDAVEVNAARSTQAIENLVLATQQLTETNKELIIAVTEIRSKG